MANLESNFDPTFKWEDHLSNNQDPYWNYMFPCTEEQYTQLSKEQKTYYMTMAHVFSFTNRMTDLLENYQREVEELPPSIPLPEFMKLLDKLNLKFKYLLRAFQELSGLQVTGSGHDSEINSLWNSTPVVRDRCLTHIAPFISQCRADLHHLFNMPSQNLFKHRASVPYVITSSLPPLIDEVIAQSENRSRAVCQAAWPPAADDLLPPGITE